MNSKREMWGNPLASCEQGPHAKPQWTLQGWKSFPRKFNAEANLKIQTRDVQMEKQQGQENGIMQNKDGEYGASGERQEGGWGQGVGAGCDLSTKGCRETGGHEVKDQLFQAKRIFPV